MTSYEFEKAAKNIVIDMLARRGTKATIEDLIGMNIECYNSLQDYTKLFTS